MVAAAHIGSVWSRPTVRFGLKVSAFLAFFLLAYRDDLLGRLLAPWAELTARATLALLQLLNIEVVRFGAQIHHSGGFAYEIYYRCTAVLVAAILAALTIATPASLRCKLVGLALGVPVLIVLNLVRLVHLFHTGVFHPAFFDLAHEIIWESILALTTLGLWWGWSRWAAKSKTARGNQNDPV